MDPTMQEVRAGLMLARYQWYWALLNAPVRTPFQLRAILSNDPAISFPKHSWKCFRLVVRDRSSCLLMHIRTAEPMGMALTYGASQHMNRTTYSSVAM